MKHRLYECFSCHQRFRKSMIARRGKGWQLCRQCLRTFRAERQMDAEAYEAAMREA